MYSATTILGTNLGSFTLNELTQEIKDLQHELRIIREYEEGEIGYSDFQYISSCDVSDKNDIIQAIELMKIFQQRIVANL